ncbi:hypothetical protein BKP35_10585 [Anaerobacillus arseniciselenatis]|uniref:HTH cro/C1-type domain-containing protein n=1 Tax=Anaerobacillus arseniciselenatis TaxID=85682 RepID=A0A1S2LMH6_9BACI|nr:helix-turn-helix transcriptional regulator [Anaerobacillus arseniciselenatis]OIJ12625.1 hypothetical protein BKP35_10585 [Anaerobacillus arseniciselenatis]
MEEEKNILAESIGIQIRRLRNINGMTQAQLAEDSICSTNFIGEIERGKIAPSFEYFIKICVGLNVDPTTLFKIINDEVYHSIEKEVIENRPERNS